MLHTRARVAAVFVSAVLLMGASKIAVPTPRTKPQASAEQTQSERAPEPVVEPLPDLSNAVSAPVAAKLPSTAEQFRRLKGAIIEGKPAVDTAKAQSDKLKAQAQALQKKLVETAARVQSLEKRTIVLDTEIRNSSAQYKVLAAGFVHDRVAVARLLAVVERLQHDVPPAMVLRPDDALGAARGAMLIGASLPDVYSQAAELARRIEKLKRTRAFLVARRADAVETAAQLRAARVNLDQLLASKQAQAETAAATYDALKAKLASIALEAADMEALLEKVASLRARPDEQNVVVVTAQNENSGAGTRRGTLLLPVVGSVRPMQAGNDHGPGVTFITSPGAQVVAPADCEVLFAGPYHKSGQVLILEVTAGYDLVLSGLDRVMVRPGDLVLAGEPVGVMPQMSQDGELYFELRQDGHSASPAPLLGLDLRKKRS